MAIRAVALAPLSNLRVKVSSVTNGSRRTRPDRADRTGRAAVARGGRHHGARRTRITNTVDEVITIRRRRSAVGRCNDGRCASLVANTVCRVVTRGRDRRCCRRLAISVATRERYEHCDHPESVQ